MSKKLLAFLAITALLLGFMWWDSYRNKKEFPKEEKAISFYGVFVRSFRDQLQRGATVIVLDDSSKVNFWSYSAALENIKLGDTLIKNVGTLKLLVKRGEEQFVYYPSSFGETFYDSTSR